MVGIGQVNVTAVQSVDKEGCPRKLYKWPSLQRFTTPTHPSDFRNAEQGDY